MSAADYLLDACAVIAFLNKEAGAETIAGLIQKAEDGEIVLYMTSIQALEVYYDRIRVKGPGLRRNLSASPLHIFHKNNRLCFP